jgi:hypothetical protein
VEILVATVVGVVAIVLVAGEDLVEEVALEVVVPVVVGKIFLKKTKTPLLN